MPGPDVLIAKIDQRVRDGMGVLSRALDVQHFSIAALGRIEILDQRAGIAEIAEGIGKLLSIIRNAVVFDGGFPGRSGLRQISSMEKNPRAMLVDIRHDGSVNLVSALWRILPELDLHVVLLIHTETRPEGVA